MTTVTHTIAGYLFLLLIVRTLSRRPGSQMTMFEFVIVFLMGGTIILATVGDDRPVTNCMGAIIAAALMHRTVSALKQRFPRLGLAIDGTPLVLLLDGRWRTEVMKRMRLADTDVMAAARTKGLRSLDEIKYAVLERNGGISVIKKPEQS